MTKFPFEILVIVLQILESIDKKLYRKSNNNGFLILDQTHVFTKHGFFLGYKKVQLRIRCE